MSCVVTLSAAVIFKYVTKEGTAGHVKAAFVNEGDAIAFWEALSEERRQHIRPFRGDEPVTLFTHVGVNRYGYSHAEAMTQSSVDKWVPELKDPELLAKHERAGRHYVVIT